MSERMFSPHEKVKILPIETYGIVTCCLYYHNEWKYEVRYWSEGEVKFQVCLESELWKVKGGLS